MGDGRYFSFLRYQESRLSAPQGMVEKKRKSLVACANRQYHTNLLWVHRDGPEGLFQGRCVFYAFVFSPFWCQKRENTLGDTHGTNNLKSPWTKTCPPTHPPHKTNRGDTTLVSTKKEIIEKEQKYNQCLWNQTGKMQIFLSVLWDSFPCFVESCWFRWKIDAPRSHTAGQPVSLLESSRVKTGAPDQQSNYTSFVVNTASSPLTQLQNMFSISTLFTQKTSSCHSVLAWSFKVSLRAFL